MKGDLGVDALPRGGAGRLGASGLVGRRSPGDWFRPGSRTDPSLSEGREFWSLTLWRLGAAPSPQFAGGASALSFAHSARENPGGSEGAGNAAGDGDHEERPDPRGGQRRVARHLLIEKRERPGRLRARAAEVRRRLVRASAMSLLCVRGECTARGTRGSHACPDT